MSEVAIVVMIVGAVTFFFAPSKADPDLWGHLRFGLDSLDSLPTGQILHPDTYSYVTGDQEWVNHEWLTELITGLAYSLAGAPGLIALKILMVLLVAAVAYAHLRRCGVAAGGTAILLVPLFAMLLPWTQSVRPQLFSYLGLAVILSILIRAETSSTRWLWWVPPVFVLWANLHGGFLVGIAFTLLWAVLHVMFGWQRMRKRPDDAFGLPAIGLALGAALIATLMNPYGMRLLIFLKTAFMSRAEIAEWHPLHPVAAEGIGYVVLVGLATVALFRSRRRPQLALAGMLLAAALLPLVARRHLPLFGIAWVLLAGEHIARAWPRLFAEPAAGTPPRSSWARALPLAIGLAAAAMATPHLRAIGVDSAGFPVRAVQLIKESGAEGRLAVFFDWGEYALWHLSPRLKVSVDGRRETVYSDAVYAESVDFIYGTGDWDRLLRRGADVVLVSTQFPVYNLMKLKAGWSLVYEDNVAAVFAPVGSAAIGRLSAVAREEAHGPDPTTLTFP